MGQVSKKLRARVSKVEKKVKQQTAREVGTTRFPRGVKDIPSLVNAGHDPVHSVYAYVQQPPSTDEVEAALRKPFPGRKRTWFTDAMALMQWSDAMSKGAYPSRKSPAPTYDPTTTVSIHLATDELEPILTRTDIAKTKKLRPRLEAMAAGGESIELNITDWSCVVLSLCGAKGDKQWGHKQLLRIAARIANQLAEALGIAPPNFSVK
jgi:hypothetical protein